MMHRLLPLGSFLLVSAGVFAACAVEDGRDGLDDDLVCSGAKCDDGGEDPNDPAEAVCWNDQGALGLESAHTEICEHFRSPAVGGGLLDGTNGEARLSWDGQSCFAILLAADTCAGEEGCICEPNLNCRVEVPVQAMLDGTYDASSWMLVGEETLEYARRLRPGADDDAADLCFLFSSAQRRCRDEDFIVSLGGTGDWSDRVQECAQSSTSCVPGLENECNRYVPPWVGATSVPTVASRCAVQSYNGLGYSDAMNWPQSTAGWNQCLQQPSGATTRACRFLGNEVDVETEFCDVLEQCVDPALRCFQDAADPTLYHLPSGDIELWTNGCEGGLNHSPEVCRGLDFNNQSNSGNIERGTVTDPEVNLPPEFVAVMEECGVTWGGRWSGLTVNECDGGRDDCCDPMHFDYAPNCVPDTHASFRHRTAPPAGLCP